MHVTITGASGKLGKYAVEEFASAYDLVLFDRTPPRSSTSLSGTAHRVVVGDLTDPAACENAVEGSQAVIHLGAIPFASEGLEAKRRMASGDWPSVPPDETMRVNTMGTYNVLDAARRAGARTVVMASSFAPLGLGANPSGALFTPAYLPVDEEHPLAPEDSYALSKYLGEEMLAAFSRGYGMRCYALRLAGVFVPEKGRLPLKERAVPQVWNNWLYTYVDARDAARAFRLCMESADTLPPFDVFNITAPESFLIEETRDVLARLRPDLVEQAASLVGHQSMMDPRKAERAFGFRAQHHWRELMDDDAARGQGASGPA